MVGNKVALKTQLSSSIGHWFRTDCPFEVKTWVLTRIILTRGRIQSSILCWSLRSKLITVPSYIDCLRFSLKSFVEVDYLAKSLHLRVNLAWSSVRLLINCAFLFSQFTPLKYLITSRRVLTTLFTPNKVIQYTITLVSARKIWTIFVMVNIAFLWAARFISLR